MALERFGNMLNMFLVGNTLSYKKKLIFWFSAGDGELYGTRAVREHVEYVD